jgi:hypothetical protein
MLTCKTCGKRKTCKAICPAIEALLPKKTTGRHKKELIVDTFYLELLAVQRAFYLRFGVRRTIFKHEMDDLGGY